MKSRIIVLSPNDPRTITAAKAMVKFYNAKDSKDGGSPRVHHEAHYFQDDCFKDFKADTVMLYGHAGTKTFGEKNLTPEQLLQKLIEFNFPFSQIQNIELFGCELGLIQNKTSYALRFAEALYKLDGTPIGNTKEVYHTKQIKIRTINNSVTHEKLDAMRVTINPDDCTAMAKGILRSEYEAYQTECGPEERKLADELHHYERFNEIVVRFFQLAGESEALSHPINQDRFLEFLNGIKTDLAELKSDLASYSFSKPINDKVLSLLVFMTNVTNSISADDVYFNYKVANLRREFFSARDELTEHAGEVHSQIAKQYADLSKKYKHVFAEWSDIRSAMYSSDKFLITHDLQPKLQKFDHNRWVVWSLLQDRIKEKQMKYKKPTLFGKTVSKLMPKLIKASDHILNSTGSIIDDIDMLLAQKILTKKQRAFLISFQDDVRFEASRKTKEFEEESRDEKAADKSGPSWI
jgi:hypothetical protein